MQDLFFLFDRPDFTKTDRVQWNLNGDRELIALASTFSNTPMALNMSFQSEYPGSYDWLKTHFKDWAFTFVSNFLYYEDYDINDEPTRD